MLPQGKGEPAFRVPPDSVPNSSRTSQEAVDVGEGDSVRPAMDRPAFFGSEKALWPRDMGSGD